MKTIKLDLVNEKVFYEKLENGLEVYMIRKKDFNSSYACFGTKFGGLDIEFIPSDEKEYKKMPSGIAHFLEHKLFEQKDGENVHEFYKKSGTYVNAYTTYKTTKYIINGPYNFKENLEYLLDFVQSPYITDENVEKEKGIILEEARMGLDNPDRKFYYTLKNNLFLKIPYNNTVIGSLDDIKSITKEDLYRCYNTFYHPSNMHLLIVSNMDENEVFDIVRNNQKKKNYQKDFNIEKRLYEEPVKVRKEKEILKENVMQSRLCYAFKMPLSTFNASKQEVFDYYSIYFGIITGGISKLNLELKEKGIIKDNISYSISIEKALNDEFLTFEFYILTDEFDEVVNLLEKELLSKKYNEDDFNLYKKTLISDMNYMFNNVNGVMSFMKIEYDFFEKIDNESTKVEMNLNYSRFKELIDKISIDNKTILIMEKK